MTEKEKMIAELDYDASDQELRQLRTECLIFLNEYNKNISENKKGKLTGLLSGDTLSANIMPPFHCDYGFNITVGENFYANFNCIMLDPAPINIGDRVMFGPNVQVYTATHPIDAKIRSEGLEAAKAITIGDDVWIGGSSIIMPGVTIGNRVVIGAGSLVTKDIPDDYLAYGNPCRPIKKINQ